MTLKDILDRIRGYNDVYSLENWAAFIPAMIAYIGDDVSRSRNTNYHGIECMVRGSVMQCNSLKIEPHTRELTKEIVRAYHRCYGKNYNHVNEPVYRLDLLMKIVHDNDPETNDKGGIFTLSTQRSLSQF